MIEENVTELELIDHDAITEIKAPVQSERIYSGEDAFSSKNFIKQKEFIRNLFNPSEHTLPLTKLSKEKEVSEEKLSIHSDFVVIIQGWENVENISSRLIEYNEDIVLLECLIDREAGIYEEREFSSSLFTGYDIEIGNLFYLRIFERPNEIRIEVHNDPGLTHKDDFPKLDFVDKFKSSRLFKEK